MRSNPRPMYTTERLAFILCLTISTFGVLLIVSRSSERLASATTRTIGSFPRSQSVEVQPVQNQVVGIWSGMTGTKYSVPLVVEFHADGTYRAIQSMDGVNQVTVSGTYQFLSDTEVEVRLQGMPDGSQPEVLEHLTVAVDQDVLKLRDQQQVEMTLTRQTR